MSDVAIFGFGSVIFMVTTWATFSFGLRRMGQLQAEELARTNQTAVVQPSGLTEIHLDEDAAGKRAVSS